MQVKTCPATVKAAGAHDGTDEGVVEAIVAAYNVDSIGDRIIPGAFKNTLDRRKAAGNPIPFVWNHQSDDPESYIGEVLEAEERPEGLWVKAKIDLDEPKALKVYKLLKGRRVTQFSFAYSEVDARPAAKTDDGARKDLHELDMFECGPTMLGCNQATSLLDVKHQQPVTVNVQNVMPGAKAEPAPAVPAPPAPEEPARPVDGELVESDDVDPVTTAQQALRRAQEDAAGQAEGAAQRVAEAQAALAAAQSSGAGSAPGEKAGRTLSARNVAALTEALATIQKVLASASTDLNDGAPAGDAAKNSSVEKATPAEPAAAPASPVAPEAAPDAKSDEPAAHGTASARLRHDLALASLEAEVAALMI